MKFHIARLAAMAALFGSTFSARAVVVENVAIAPAQNVIISVSGFYTGPAMAGINQLLVDGVAANGFCIDPYHFSVPYSDGYEFISLADAPKAPGTTGAAKADQISQLWAMAYSPGMTASQAASFQIAIWEIVGGSNFLIWGSDYGASALIHDLESYAGKGADLIALTGPGQDFVIEDFRAAAPVADNGTTMVLLFLGVAVIVALESRRLARA